MSAVKRSDVNQLVRKLKLGVPVEDVVALHVGLKRGTIVADVVCRSNNGKLLTDSFGVRTKALYRSIEGDDDVDEPVALGPLPRS